tara:strand:+ start:45 stop:743 length:699 start_codon:yes stop_codon:yes gene_type:complete
MKNFRNPFFASMMLFLLVFTSCEKSLDMGSQKDNINVKDVDPATDGLNNKIGSFNDALDRFKILDENNGWYSNFVSWTQTENLGVSFPSSLEFQVGKTYNQQYSDVENLGIFTVEQLGLISSFRNNLINGVSFDAAHNLLQSEVNAIGGSADQKMRLNAFVTGISYINQTQPNLFSGNGTSRSQAVFSPCADAVISMGLSVIGMGFGATTVVGLAFAYGVFAWSAVLVDENC